MLREGETMSGSGAYKAAGRSDNDLENSYKAAGRSDKDQGRSDKAPGRSRKAQFGSHKTRIRPFKSSSKYLTISRLNPKPDILSPFRGLHRGKKRVRKHPFETRFFKGFLA